MGHIAHLRNQFKSKNMTVSYHWLEENTHSFVRIEWILFFILPNLKIPFTKGCFMPRLIEIGPVILERKIFKFCPSILLFRCNLPLEKPMALGLNKSESPSPKDALSQVWLKLVKWFWRRFLNSSMHFHYFIIIFPWKRVWPFIWTNLNSHLPIMLCAKFGWKMWPTFLERKILKFCQCIFTNL